MDDNAVLKDVVRSIADCEHKTAPRALPGSEHAFSIGTPNIRGGRIDLTSAKRVDERTYEGWTKRGRPERDDLILAREAPVGEVGYVDGKARLCLGQRTVLIRPNQDRVHPRYLHYLLLSPPIQQWMQERAEGSTVPHLNVADVRRIELGVLPPLREQQTIAELLGALDDKIVVNRRKATLLDSYVRTKYSEEATAVQSTARLGSLVEQGLGGVWGGDVPTSAEDIRTRCLRGVDLAMLVNGELPSPPIRWLSPKPFTKRAWSDGEIWVEGSGSFCGRSLFVGQHLGRIFDEPVRNSNFVKRLIPTVSKDAVAWAWLSMRKAYDDGEFDKWRTGSAFPNLDVPGLLDGLVVPLPDAEVLTRMSALVDLLQDPTLIRETRALVALRETLLPPLLSGELRVRDAEEMVGEAV